MVRGKVAPETEKPVPAAVAALTVTAEEPVEDKVNVWLAGVLTFTLPNDRLDELTPSVMTAASSCKAVVWVTLVAVAESVTD